MKHDEFVRHDGLGLAALIRQRDVSAAEVLEAAVAAVEARNHEINAVVSRLYDQARAAIAAGLPPGPFTGVPYLLKDLGAHYRGAVTSYGGTLFKDFVVDHDSEMTARLKRAGRSWAWPARPSHASSGPRAIRGASRTMRAARAAARRRRSRPAWSRWPTPPTAAARSASPPRRAGSSG